MAHDPTHPTDPAAPVPVPQAPVYVGIDVPQDTLDLARDEGGPVLTLADDPAGVAAVVALLGGPFRVGGGRRVTPGGIALLPAGTYHSPMTDYATEGLPPPPAGGVPAARCERCGGPLGPADLACPTCGALTHREELERLAAEAMRWEAADRGRAVRAWFRCLELLPRDSEQFRMIARRVETLAPGISGGHAVGQAGGVPVLNYRPAGDDGPAETWQSVLYKTGGSMLLSVMLYSRMGGWEFAVGFVLLIFVHEMGHVLANWYYGIRQSAPIFLGIFGAVIFVKGRIRSAKEEAVMGIAGPVFGTVAALVCYAWFYQTGSDLAAVLAYFGMFINLWNLLPVPPLDGGARRPPSARGYGGWASREWSPTSGSTSGRYTGPRPGSTGSGS